MWSHLTSRSQAYFPELSKAPPTMINKVLLLLLARLVAGSPSVAATRSLTPETLCVCPGDEATFTCSVEEPDGIFTWITNATTEICKVLSSSPQSQCGQFIGQLQTSSLSTLTATSAATNDTGNILIQCYYITDLVGNATLLIAGTPPPTPVLHDVTSGDIQDNGDSDTRIVTLRWTLSEPVDCLNTIHFKVTPDDPTHCGSCEVGPGGPGVQEEFSCQVMQGIGQSCNYTVYAVRCGDTQNVTSSSPPPTVTSSSHPTTVTSSSPPPTVTSSSHPPTMTSSSPHPPPVTSSSPHPTPVTSSSPSPGDDELSGEVIAAIVVVPLLFLIVIVVVVTTVLVVWKRRGGSYTTQKRQDKSSSMKLETRVKEPEKPLPYHGTIMTETVAGKTDETTGQNDYAVTQHGVPNIRDPNYGHLYQDDVEQSYDVTQHGEKPQPRPFIADPNYGHLEEDCTEQTYDVTQHGKPQPKLVTPDANYGQLEHNVEDDVTHHVKPQPLIPDATTDTNRHLENLAELQYEEVSLAPMYTLGEARGRGSGRRQ